MVPFRALIVNNNFWTAQSIKKDFDDADFNTVIVAITKDTLDIVRQKISIS